MARRRRQQAAWRRRNPDYFAARRILVRKSIPGPVEPLRVPPPLDQLPWDIAQSEFGVQGADFMGIMGALLLHLTQFQFASQVPDSRKDAGTLLSAAAQSEIVAGADWSGARSAGDAAGMAPTCHISDHDYLFGRASVINNTQGQPGAVEADFGESVANEPRNFILSETHNFTPGLINTGILSANRQIEGSFPDNLSLLTQYTDTNFSDGSLTGWGPNAFYAGYYDTTYNPQDRMEWSKGKHLLSFGIEYKFGVYDERTLGTTNGSYTFSPGTPLPVDIPSIDGGPTIAAGTPSPNSLVSMMAGAAFSYTKTDTVPGFSGPSYVLPYGFRIWRLGAYFQDDYKVTPKLTLNLGLRDEYASVPHEVLNRISRVAETGPLAYQLVINPTPLYDPERLNLAPRLGFAYALTNQTAVRGGIGIFTNFIPFVYDDQGALFPGVFGSTILSPTYALAPTVVTLPPLVSTSGEVIPPNGDPKQIPPNTPLNLVPITNIIGGVEEAFLVSQHLKNGYTYNGNLTVEQKLPADMALQATFVTSTALDLFNEGYINAYTGAEPQYTPYSTGSPGLGEIAVTKNQALSHYNALQVQFRKISPLHGLQYQASYTWASNLADADSVFSDYGPSGGITPQNPFCVRCEYGRANSDVRHRLVANFTYSIPGRWGVMPSRISNGWQLLGIFQIQSGFPFNVLEPYGTLQYGDDNLEYPYGGVRPNVGSPTTKAPGWGKGPQSAQYFSNDVINNVSTYFPSPQVFSPIQNTEVQDGPGTLARNAFTSPSWWNADFSMIKETKLLETLNMQFRAEFFNVFNHTELAAPDSLIGPSGSGFGQIFSTNFASERQIQFGMRFVF